MPHSIDKRRGVEEWYIGSLARTPVGGSIFLLGEVPFRVWAPTEAFIGGAAVTRCCRHRSLTARWPTNLGLRGRHATAPDLAPACGRREKTVSSLPQRLPPRPPRASKSSFACSMPFATSAIPGDARQSRRQGVRRLAQASCDPSVKGRRSSDGQAWHQSTPALQAGWSTAWG